jgi:hypothetical protein
MYLELRSRLAHACWWRSVTLSSGPMQSHVDASAIAQAEGDCSGSGSHWPSACDIPLAAHAGTHVRLRIRTLRRNKPDVDAHPSLRPGWPSSRARCNQSRTIAATIVASDVYLRRPDVDGIVQGDGLDDDDTPTADDDDDDEPR